MVHQVGSTYQFSQTLCPLIGAFDPLGTYHIGGSCLRMLPRGVLVASNLKTTQDTLRVATAERIWGAIRRSFSRMTTEIFKLLFTFHLGPKREYGLLTTFTISKLGCTLIKRVQRRGTNFVFRLRDISYSFRPEEMSLFSLEYRRRRGDLVYTRRILRGERGNELRQFFQLKIGGPTRGHN